MLTLRQLETFRCVMRVRTTVGAAKELRVSQPAVSNAIRQLETQVGFALFERVGNRLVPTPDAEDMFRDSDAIFSLYHALSHRIEGRKNRAAGTLRIVTTPPLANALVPAAIRSFLAKRPGVRISLDTRRVDGVLESVETRSADLGFALNPPERDGLSFQRIAGGQMVCAFVPGHPLEDKLEVTARDLEGLPLVLYEPQSRLNRAIDERFVTPRMRAEAVAEVSYSTLACLLAEAGVGVTLVDSLTAMSGARYRLSFRPLHPRQFFDVSTVMRSNEPGRRIISAFLEEVRGSKFLELLCGFAEDEVLR